MTTITGDRTNLPETSTALSNRPVIDEFARLETDILCYQHLVSGGMLKAAEDLKNHILSLSATDYVIRTYCVERATFLKSYNGHQDTVKMIVPHPIYEEVVVTCGHDGIINIWNFRTGQTYKRLGNYATDGSDQVREKAAPVIHLHTYISVKMMMSIIDDVISTC
uniref:WD_REPEATS_REGION domain-containing protein n=1 Tax=Rhabditophanes sp. KR3021 TaxID=114890 RepID=A0AC35U272_9BILA